MSGMRPVARSDSRERARDWRCSQADTFWGLLRLLDQLSLDRARVVAFGGGHNEL
ncbi:hypothetical protein ACL02O_28035 [Micromonospora sp. MS34]|uniref:hypothetical protein n=1 Tax=Micromonospora sp. MS34 TaxID=3385971 RepID=UPI0039A08F27